MVTGTPYQHIHTIFRLLSPSTVRLFKSKPNILYSVNYFVLITINHIFMVGTYPGLDPQHLHLKEKKKKKK
jgi:hypothetical protein